MDLPASHRWLHRYAVVVACCTLFLVFAGGLVTSKGAGLAVPDWPLSYGSVNPDGWFEKENVRAEHGHRLLAAAVGMLTLALAIFTWAVEPRRRVRLYGILACEMVLFQALLGGTIIWYFGKLEARMVHAVTGQTFFCIMVGYAILTSPRWRLPVRRTEDSGPLGIRALSVLLIATVFLQLLFGAFMRHIHAGLAIPDFPLSYGGVLPPLDDASIKEINSARFMDGLQNITRVQILSHFIHRVQALAVCAVAGLAAWRVFSRHSARSALVMPAVGILVLLGLQVVLGILIIFTGRQPHVASAHVAVGASILALSVVLCMQAFREVASGVARTEPASAPAGGEAVSA